MQIPFEEAKYALKLFRAINDIVDTKSGVHIIMATLTIHGEICGHISVMNQQNCWAWLVQV